MFRSFPMGFPSTALPRATPGDHLAIYFHCCEGPRGDVQIQDVFVELILHRVEEDTWENIIESLLQGLDVTEVNGLVQKIETGNRRFLKIMGLSCHFSLKPIRSRGNISSAMMMTLIYFMNHINISITLGKMEETSDN